MAAATRIKGGKVRVELDPTGNGTYAAPCGFSSRSVTFSKGLEEVSIPDCNDPDKIDWIGRDAVSLSMGINGEGVLTAESQETWFDAWHSTEPVAAKIEIEFPATTVTWTGLLHIESLEIGAPNARTATLNVSMSSDGEMVRTTT